MKKFYFFFLVIFLSSIFWSTNVYSKTSIKIKGGDEPELEFSSSILTSEISIDDDKINVKDYERQEECEEGEDGEDDNSIVRIFGMGNLEAGNKVDSVVLIFSEGTISGRISDDCVVIGGKVNLRRGAEIGGDMVTILSSVNKDKTVKIKGDEVSIFTYQASGVLEMVKSIFTSWDILLALLFILFFWRYIKGLTDRFLSNPMSPFLSGFLWLILFIPLIIVLAISILGIFLIPLVPLIYMAGFAFGFAVMACYTGDKLAGLSGRDFKDPLRSVAGLFIILLIFKIISFFPLLGGLSVEVIKMIIRTMGLGLLISIIWESAFRKKRI